MESSRESMTYLKRLIKDTAPNHEGGRAELSISHGQRQRIQLPKGGNHEEQKGNNQNTDAHNFRGNQQTCPSLWLYICYRSNLISGQF